MHINIGGAMEILVIKTYEIFQCKTRADTTWLWKFYSNVIKY